MSTERQDRGSDLPTREGEVRVFAPATIGNAACGFDVFGIALERPGDEIVARRSRGPGVRIRTITGDEGRLPTESRLNSASIAAAWILARHAPGAGVELDIHKGLPLSSGMGGSAASAVGGALATVHLLGLAVAREEVLQAVKHAEQATAGSPHLDNAAPCLLGGWTLVRSIDPVEVLRLPVPEGLAVALVHPDLEVNTGEARAMLGTEVALTDAVTQWGNTAAVVHGLHTSDLELIGRSLVDAVAEPIRSRWVPGFRAVIAAAHTAGALGASLSGSGPSLFALCADLDTAIRAGEAMVDAFEISGGVRADAFVSRVAGQGARVVGASGSPNGSSGRIERRGPAIPGAASEE